MTYKEFKDILKHKFGASRPADIAKEFDVTPQVVNAWKLRQQVPYKYVKILRKKINSHNLGDSSDKIHSTLPYVPSSGADGLVSVVAEFVRDIILNVKLIAIIASLSSLYFFADSKYISSPIFLSTSKMIAVSDNLQAEGISGIAGQLGLSIGQQNNVNMSSSQMVPEILKCRSVLSNVVRRKFSFGPDGESIALINLWFELDRGISEWSEKKIQKATSILGKKISVIVSRRNPLITLYVEASSPVLARKINEAIIEESQKFMINSKISKVSDKKLFILNRIKEVERDLSVAEDKLKNFREKNRSINSSPALALQQERLDREVEVQTEVFITLKSQYELIQIEEVNKPKMIEVLDPPENSNKPIHPRKPLINSMIGLVLGLIIGFAITIGKKVFKENKTSINKYIVEPLLEQK